MNRWDLPGDTFHLSGLKVSVPSSDLKGMWIFAQFSI